MNRNISWRKAYTKDIFENMEITLLTTFFFT
jgi:hypothetical protein